MPHDQQLRRRASLSARAAVLRFLPAALAIALAGCTAQGQIAKIQSEKEALKSLVESEKRRNAELAVQLQAAAERVAEAERELAIAHSGGGRPSRNTSPSSLVNTQVGNRGDAATSLEQWSRSEPLLKFDPLHRTARVQLDLAFTGDDRPLFDSRRELDKVADLLSSPQGLRCGVKVYGIESKAGDPAALRRATAVAEYLQRVRNLAAHRVEVASRGARELVDEEGRRVATPGVQGVELELFELSSGETVANDPTAKPADGWTSPAGRRR
jgi:hypothetical protein